MPHDVAALARSCSTSTRRSIFPEGDFGIAFTNSTCRTFLYGDTRVAMNCVTSSAVSGECGHVAGFEPPVVRHAGGGGADGTD